MGFRTAKSSKFTTLGAGNGEIKVTQANYTRKRKPRNMVSEVLRTRNGHEKELVQSVIDQIFLKHGAKDGKKQLDQMMRYLDKNNWRLADVCLEVEKRRKCGTQYADPMPTIQTQRKGGN